MLSLSLPVSKQVQSKQNDFHSARTQINDLISVLKSRRIDFAHFDGVFQSASECMKELDEPVVQPRVSKRQVSRANPPASTPSEFYRRAIYLPLLDAVTTDMQSCFDEETVSNLSKLTYLAACDKQTFPLIHAFLSILLTLPVASEHSTCRKKLFYASKTQIMDEDKDE